MLKYYETTGHTRRNTYLGDTINILLKGDKISSDKVTITDIGIDGLHQFNLKDEKNGNIHCVIIAGMLLFQDDTGCDYKAEEIVEYLYNHFRDTEYMDY